MRVKDVVVSSGLAAAITLTMFAVPATAHPSESSAPTPGAARDEPVDQDRIEQIDALSVAPEELFGSTSDE